MGNVADDGIRALRQAFDRTLRTLRSGLDIASYQHLEERGRGKATQNIRQLEILILLEFNLDKDSNSGLYLRGRYEIQIADSHDKPLNVHSRGAIYGFKTPPVDACKPAGEWQKYEVTLVANRVTVIHNGTRIVDDFAIPGITGGALDANEGEPGPIMLRGDRGKVQFS